MSTRIHFIGTVHTDPLGKQRLGKALLCEKPTILTIECSKKLIEYVENEAIPSMHKKIDSCFSGEEAEFLKKHFGEIDFEIEATRRYAIKNDTPLYYVDHHSPVESAKRKNYLFLKLSADDLRTFLNPSSLRREIAGTDAVYNKYQKLFEKFDDEEQNKVDLEARHFGQRDIYMAQNIEKLIEPGARLVHVGGLGHCLKDTKERTLFSKLHRYNPTRETLKWYDDV